MNQLRNYQQWLLAYDDPTSDLSWRLRQVQAYVREALDAASTPIRILSACAGDGRDVLKVLRERDDIDRASVTLIELHPAIAQQARRAALDSGLANVVVRTADAGNTDAYVGAVPADLVLLMGIFGNISDDDLRRTIQVAPQLCAPGATVLWSRGRDHSDRNDVVRAWFHDAGFNELDYRERNAGTCPALGAMRYDGEPAALVPGQPLFTFWR